jgi:hypothetical protein
MPRLPKNLWAWSLSFCLLCALFAILLAYRLSHPPRQPLRSKLDRVELEMKREEVIQLLGPGWKRLTWRGPPSEERLGWKEDRFTAIVVFRDGRVFLTDEATDPEPGLLQRLHDLFRSP